MLSEFKTVRILALLLAVLLLAGCAAAVPSAPEETDPPSPEPTPEPASEPAAEPAPEDGVYTVSTPEQFIRAIGPDRTIVLAADTLNLAEAYRSRPETGSEYCRWEEVYDGYELVVSGVSGLTVQGEGCTICTDPRYANVLKFTRCSGLTLRGFTAGHTEEPGICSGGVLLFQGCRDVSIDSCHLFGCGSIGLALDTCGIFSVENTEIYDCSYEAVDLFNSFGCRFSGCRFHGFSNAMRLFWLESSDSIEIAGCEIYGCVVQELLVPNGSSHMYFTGNLVRNCTFYNAVFSLANPGTVVDTCQFTDCSITTWFDGAHAVSAEGTELYKEDLVGMKLGQPVSPAPVPEKPPVEPSEDGIYDVRTVDEFLAAIGPNRTVRLAEGIYDLSSADGYGAYGGESYQWRECYDGPELTISGVENLTICSEAASGKCVITTVPRYANVLRFLYCSGIRLQGITFGHTVEPGACVGGVILLDGCLQTELEDCRLYGCGILGIEANGCAGLTVRHSEIYDCSQGGVSLRSTSDAVFESNDCHDLGGPVFSLTDTSRVIVDGEPAADGFWQTDGAGKLTEYTEPYN